MVGLLYQPIGLHADFSSASVDSGSIEVGIDPGRNPVDDLNFEEIGAGPALVAVGGNLPQVRRLIIHRVTLSPPIILVPVKNRKDESLAGQLGIPIGSVINCV